MFNEVIYRGARSPEGVAQVWCYTGSERVPLPLQPGLKLAAHSPTGFEWGYYGAGPAQLALALLLDATADAKAARRWYGVFMVDVVSQLPDAWGLSRREIRRWLKEREKGR